MSVTALVKACVVLVALLPASGLRLRVSYPNVTYNIAGEGNLASTDVTDALTSLYQIVVAYEYANPTPGADAVDLQTDEDIFLVFSQSTLQTFSTLSTSVTDAHYCSISGLDSSANYCSSYQGESRKARNTAYGTIASQASPDHMYQVISSSRFKQILADYLSQAVRSGFFTISSVSVSAMDNQAVEMNVAVIPQQVTIAAPLPTAHIVVYALPASFMALCCLLMCISKLYSVYVIRDDIEWKYSFCFMLFAVNMLMNCISVPWRIFDYKTPSSSPLFIVIALACGGLLLMACRWLGACCVIKRSQRDWSSEAFIAKRLREWHNRYNCLLVTLSVVSGPVAALAFCNSRVFVHDVLFMDMPYRVMQRVLCNAHWNVLLSQRLPELALQITFAALIGWDPVLLLAHATTLLCVVVMAVLKVHTMMHSTDSCASSSSFSSPAHQSENLVQRAAFLMEISSPEINENVSRYVLRPNAFKESIADVLELTYPGDLEVLSFEPIRVGTENNYNKQKVLRTYGLKVYFTMHTTTMLRRYALMKLEKAISDDTLGTGLQQAWNLSEPASVDDIVMVYDVLGEILMQRVRSWEESNNPESIQLREIQDSNVKFCQEEREVYILKLQKELEEMAKTQLVTVDEEDEADDDDMEQSNDGYDDDDNSSDTCNDTSVTVCDGGEGHHRRKSTNPFDAFFAEELKARSTNKKHRHMRARSKFHIQDASDMSMNLDFEAYMPDSGALQMERLCSSSSIHSMISI